MQVRGNAEKLGGDYEYDKTVRFKQTMSGAVDSGELAVTVFDGHKPPRTLRLGDFGKHKISFGRDPTNDIVFDSPLVTRQHGRFSFKNGQWHIEDKALYEGEASTNGLIYNNAYVLTKALHEGDFIRIDDGMETLPDGVLLVFASPGSESRWASVAAGTKAVLTIGRDARCDIVLPHISVSKLHAKILCEGGRFYIEDNKSANGVVVNNCRISSRRRLHEKDVIAITNTKLIFTSKAIFYCWYKSGVSVDTSKVVIVRGKGKKSFVTGNNISLNINPGELIAVIGGSGTGKSTILNCMCGYLKPTSGSVYINGIDLYRNFDSLKKLIGYVPQSDIVYNNLTLYDMLSYTAKLRLPQDTSPTEREAAIDRAIRLVELTEKKGSLIGALSGGQRKRASIAVELLSDPNLLFLDEPTSGLDPGTERSLMTSLRRMANGGKTVILVTHSTLQLRLCDRIMFMGRGGNLCYLGSYDDALKFFGASDVVDTYDLIAADTARWRDKYDKSVVSSGKTKDDARKFSSAKSREGSKLPVLCSRYTKLILNDRKRLMLLLAQAPILAALIAFVANGKQFEQYEMTKSLLFSLSCSAFWIGMLNAIQEVCKERDIMKREYMTGLSLTSYILSKILVLGLFCLIQSVLIVSTFALFVGLPEKGLLMPPYAEILVTTFLTAVSSTAMGLFVSSLFTNADRAMTLAPILLMPQILFSGLIFKLSGATEVISWLAVCRWSMEGYGTTANLNALPLRLQQEGIGIDHIAEDFFRFKISHIAFDWGILILFTAVFLVLARLVLGKIGKERS